MLKKLAKAYQMRRHAERIGYQYMAMVPVYRQFFAEFREVADVLINLRADVEGLDDDGEPVARVLSMSHLRSRLRDAPAANVQPVACADKLPEMLRPVVPVWYRDNGKGGIRATYGDRLVYRGVVERDEDTETWLWVDHYSGELMEWDEDELPTHWLEVPGLPLNAEAVEAEERMGLR